MHCREYDDLMIQFRIRAEYPESTKQQHYVSNEINTPLCNAIDHIYMKTTTLRVGVKEIQSLPLGLSMNHRRGSND